MDVLPKRLVRMLLEMPEDYTSVGMMTVLLIELDERDGAVAQTLRRTMTLAPLDGTGMTSTKAFSVRERRTPAVVHRPAPTPQSLRKRLSVGSHFAIFPIKRNPLDSDPRVLIGRSPKRDIVLSDPSVSTSHAWLIDDVLGDEGSRNGTRVNGNAITQATSVDVFPGDDILFGNVRTTLVSLKTLRAALLADAADAAR